MTKEDEKRLRTLNDLYNKIRNLEDSNRKLQSKLKQYEEVVKYAKFCVDEYNKRECTHNFYVPWGVEDLQKAIFKLKEGG